METAIWQNFIDDGVLFVGISNTNNQNVISNFVDENSLTFPILYDSGSSGGVQGGDTYDDYHMPNDGSPYPRDFIINQDGIIAYANNEIDTEWMISVIYDLVNIDNSILGDVNDDGIINIQDVILTVNIILNSLAYNETADLNGDSVVDVLDVINIVNLILN